MAADLSAFTEIPESPQISGEGVTKETVRIYAVDNSLNWLSKLPARAEVGADGYFARYSSRHGPGYTIVSLYWASSLSDPGSIARSRADNTIENDLSIDRIEKPLESKIHSPWVAGDYLMMWNYDLWQSSATEPVGALPAWATTAYTADDANGVDYVWAKSKPAQTDTTKQWWRIQVRTKPGVEVYPVIQPVVTSRKYCKTKATAIAYLKTTIAKVAPPEGYGWGTNAANWLSFPIGIANDGEFWVAQNEYIYADSWDSDLYGST